MGSRVASLARSARGPRSCHIRATQTCLLGLLPWLFGGIVRSAADLTGQVAEVPQAAQKNSCPLSILGCGYIRWTGDRDAC